MAASISPLPGFFRLPEIALDQELRFGFCGDGSIFS